jgi:diguanylate cyclase (GGDEF)-like protein/PAS domain S-box-containing protein
LGRAVNGVTVAWAATWAALAVVAFARLLRASGQPEPSVKNGYRWFGVAAGCAAVGAIVQQMFGGLAGGAQPLRLADLISLAALPALAIGLATLTSGPARGEGGHDGSGQTGTDQTGTDQTGTGLTGTDQTGTDQTGTDQTDTGETGTARGMLVDSCLLTSALFVLLLVTLFGPDYVPAEIGRAAFALALIRPVAEIVALGIVLRFVVRSFRLAALPVASLAAIIVADSLAVADRVAGNVPGLGSRVALAAALVLLAVAPMRARRLVSAPAVRPSWSERSWSSPATVAALAATAAAAIAVTAFAIAGRPLLARPVAAAGSVVVLLLVVRLAGLTRQASAVADAAQESDWMFRALAGTTSDAVLICGLTGTVEYASHAVGEFGYTPEALTGRQLGDFVHPEDRSAAVRAALAGLGAAAGTATFAGRVRGADGSWRHVESTMSRYGEADEPARLLITARDVSDRVALRRQLTQLTYHDGLTGLPNRSYIEERVRELGSCLDTGSGEDACDSADVPMPDGAEVTGVILVDFDGYANVNDVAGHAGGDLILAQAGRRLRAAVPPTATVARWAGDEFAVLLSPEPPEMGVTATGQEVIELAEHLAGLIAGEPFTVADKEIALTASVGVAVAPAKRAGHVLANAQTALAKAQDAGVGRVEIFAPAMDAEAARRLELTADLGRAITEHALEIEYLPVMDLASSQIRSVEAAAVWSRDHEQVSPAEFLAVAEESGLIVQLGSWLLRRACRQVATWRERGMDIGLSMACTARQASGPGFVSSVLSALDDAALPPAALTLEVSERMLTDSPPSVAADLAGLRGKGIKLALDCFGTGLVSLASLRNSAVDVVKIDASYVAGLDADPTLAALTRSIIQLGQDLGIDVIADGIERPEQRWRLESMGCVLGQGPGVAGPMTPSELEPTAVPAGDTACSTTI